MGILCLEALAAIRVSLTVLMAGVWMVQQASAGLQMIGSVYGRDIAVWMRRLRRFFLAPQASVTPTAANGRQPY
ncbi:MAG TPA: hypothetical protein VGL45_10680 [Bradyrhizobium sp.]